MRHATEAAMCLVTVTDVPARKMNWSDTVLKLVGVAVTSVFRVGAPVFLGFISQVPEPKVRKRPIPL